MVIRPKELRRESCSGQGILLVEQTAAGAENFQTGDRVPEELAWIGLSKDGVRPIEIHEDPLDASNAELIAAAKLGGHLRPTVDFCGLKDRQCYPYTK